MAERMRVSRQKPDEVGQEHRVRHQESESLTDQLHAYEQDTFSISASTISTEQ